MATTGIKETQEMVKFVIELVQAIDKSIKDGLSVFDMANFVAPILLASQAFNNADNIPEELRNMDEVKLQLVFSEIVSDMEADGKTQEMIKKALEIGTKIFDLYLLIKTK